MKFSSILLLSLGLVSGAAMAGGTTEAELATQEKKGLPTGLFVEHPLAWSAPTSAAAVKQPWVAHWAQPAVT